MGTHLGALLTFAALTSIALATLARDEPRARRRFGVRLFVVLVLGVASCGWLMSRLPD